MPRSAARPAAERRGDRRLVERQVVVEELVEVGEAGGDRRVDAAVRRIIARRSPGASGSLSWRPSAPLGPIREKRNVCGAATEAVRCGALGTRPSRAPMLPLRSPSPRTKSLSDPCASMAYLADFLIRRQLSQSWAHRNAEWHDVTDLKSTLSRDSPRSSRSTLATL